MELTEGPSGIIGDQNGPVRRTKKLPFGSFSIMELMTGLEPVTSALPRRCTTGCATSAYLVLFVLQIFLKYKLRFEGSAGALPGRKVQLASRLV